MRVNISNMMWRGHQDTTDSLTLMHCIKTVPTVMNNTITTPFWSIKTTTSDISSSINESSEVETMVIMIFVMVMLVISYAAGYRLCSKEKHAQALAQGKQPDRKLEYTLAYLTLVEATVESAPQLTIQIYLSITNTLTATTQTIDTPAQALNYTLLYLNCLLFICCVPSVTMARVHINSATFEELLSIPGVGAKIAAKIWKLREDNGILELEDLREVPYKITEAALESMDFSTSLSPNRWSNKFCKGIRKSCSGLIASYRQGVGGKLRMSIPVNQ
ncbi:Hypothetical predicted protein [Mytilus galloprovincialis]|uniref:Helix-hairpin-helix DNA-binding motif class 1 domain-containing protein n=1 Tax=Mytilus galloprovincialis TaxID=29158 RepID=A0A8B6CZ69_MYTGA|nr:Hypothetical predicted protein [Mytilus galloprovincialis]